MSDDEKKASWWTTLPGILTATAALITAVTGLVLGLGQLGLFDRQPSGEANGSATSTIGPAAGGGGSQAGETSGAEPTTGPTAGPATGSVPSSSDWTVTLPEQRSYRSGDIEYTLLDAAARPDVGDQLAMEITIRCTNHGRYDSNFWDANFRLDAGDVSIAPNSGLNEICVGDSSTTGTVRFVFPSEVRDPVLRIKFYEGESQAPLQITPA